MSYVVLMVLWVGWCVLHSALISLAVTEPLRRRYPNAFRYYRIFYNVLSVVTLVPVVYYGTTLRGDPLVSWQGGWQLVPILLGLIAMFFLVSGALRYDLRQFLGLRQLVDEKTCSVLTDDCTLDTGGVLSIVRHPWYSAGILVVWARPLDTAAIVTNLVICGYFVVGAILEERKLKRQFGRQYADYQQRVSMLFPIKWMTRLVSTGH